MVPVSPRKATGTRPCGRQCCGQDKASQNTVPTRPLTVSQEVDLHAASWTPQDHSIRICIFCQQLWSLLCARRMSAWAEGLFGTTGPEQIPTARSREARMLVQSQAGLSHRCLSRPSCPHMNIMRGSPRQGRGPSVSNTLSPLHNGSFATTPEILKLASAVPSPSECRSGWHIPDFPFF